jgi:hypothetical protein
MIDVLEKFLKDEDKEFEIVDGIFDTLKKEIKSNSNLIKKANEIDITYNRNTIDLQKLEEIIDKYKFEPALVSTNSKVVIYTGDPYLTLELLLQSLKKHKRILLAFNEYMLGTNELILSIFYEVLKRYKITNLIYSITKVTPELIQELNILEEEVIVIGDSAVNQLLKKSNFYSYKNYIMYSENEELEKLKEAIFLFTSEYEYELEIVYEDNIDDVISQVNDSVADSFILLTTNERTKERVRDEIKNKKIYINENPFKENNEKIRFYL